MADELTSIVGRMVLNIQAEAAEHIRTCVRCERLFLIGFEDKVRESELSGRLWMPQTEVWLITNELLPDLRQCNNWPKGA